MLAETTRHIILSCATGSHYSSSGINKAVCSSFGEDKLLLGNATSTKIAITATTTDKSSTVIFSNYNGPQRPVGCGAWNIPSYTSRMLIEKGYMTPSGEVGREMKVWEAARATSAASPYFKPYKGYHDGGLGGHNNPVNLALWEQDLLWDRKGKQPDFVLSLGTGSTIESIDGSDTQGNKNASWISQLFLPRLVRSFMKLLDGQKTWLELFNSVPQEHRSRYHRFTLGFHGPEPKLDDVSCMQGLRERVDTDAPLLRTEIRRCTDNMLASLFYLELDCLPLSSGYNFLCKARILCRWDPGSRGVHALLSMHGLLFEQGGRSQ
ncbi:hypothetical protein VC83_06606 [Pseudogymnoascus destructans]|uniref:PNPLA domain-containing protein n=1 Tax=Pseudogymnoascus destructans TaxID=655981 RepID=A0A177AB62_9PEZI|nr:uncharacterized protein VC83_06606 [Pseudogymnoascus destructans]OAF58334.2 hypothetical protein VC83_06606 [Pseudogymnoascus destructans]